MPQAEPLRFKVAAASEFEQIFRLGYDTFVEEIPQHPPNAERRHVDRFHAENTYLVALAGDEVVGMLALRGARPFSLDEKLGGVDPYLPAGRSICELRLLAVRPAHRRGMVFRGLVDLLMRHGRAAGYDLAIISGTTRQAKLYRHLGFTPFGPLVGTADAAFQPMYITIEHFEETTPVLAGAPVPEASQNGGPPRAAAAAEMAEPLNFLPGPVPLAPEVRAAFARVPVSHRDGPFREQFDRARARLRRLTGARHAEILLGSGTLANDVVAGQIALLDAPGVVVSNGEFGERLIDQARRMRLPFEPVRFAWGEPIAAAEVEAAVVRADARWIWGVASETSTGMLNPLDAWRALSERHGLALCLDCVSAIGAVPVDLDGVYLASGASGKALAGLPGLAIVFHDGDVVRAPDRLPRYLDLGYCVEKDGIPFTHSSNLVAALDTALDRFDRPEPFAAMAELARWLRPRLAELGLDVLVPEPHATPAIVTIPLPASIGATALGDGLQRLGFCIAYQSEYLERRNWVQIALMGAVTRAGLERLVAALAGVMPAVAASASAR